MDYESSTKNYSVFDYRAQERLSYNRADPIRGSDGVSKFGYDGQGGKEYILD